METKAEKIRVAKTKERGEEAGSRKEKEKPKKEQKIGVRKVVEEWEIWDEEKEAAKSKEKAKKLVLEKFSISLVRKPVKEYL